MNFEFSIGLQVIQNSKLKIHNSIRGCHMQRIWTTELAGHVGERVYLAGWLHRLRRLGNVSFLVLRDAKGLAQVVIEDPALAGRLAKIKKEWVLRVGGWAVPEPQAPGGVEVREPVVELVS